MDLLNLIFRNLQKVHYHGIYLVSLYYAYIKFSFEILHLKPWDFKVLKLIFKALTRFHILVWTLMSSLRELSWLIAQSSLIAGFNLWEIRVWSVAASQIAIRSLWVLNLLLILKSKKKRFFLNLSCLPKLKNV